MNANKPAFSAGYRVTERSVVLALNSADLSSWWSVGCWEAPSVCGTASCLQFSNFLSPLAANTYSDSSANPRMETLYSAKAVNTQDMNKTD